MSRQVAHSNQRRESALIKHTNLLCIDIDSKDNRMVDLPECKAILENTLIVYIMPECQLVETEYF